MANDMGGLLATTAVVGPDMRGLYGTVRSDRGDMVGLLKPPRPTFISYSYSGHSGFSGGSVSSTQGDLIVLVLLKTSAGTVAAPSGWTKWPEVFSDANPYEMAVYSSQYDPANAAVNTTNFPYANGHFWTVSYRAERPLRVIQVKFGDSTSAVRLVTVRGINPVPADSKQVAFLSSRDPGAQQISSLENMTNKSGDAQFTFFTTALFEAGGPSSGERRFTRVLVPAFNQLGLVLEIGR